MGLRRPGRSCSSFVGLVVPDHAHRLPELPRRQPRRRAASRSSNYSDVLTDDPVVSFDNVGRHLHQPPVPRRRRCSGHRGGRGRRRPGRRRTAGRGVDLDRARGRRSPSWHRCDPASCSPSSPRSAAYLEQPLVGRRRHRPVHRCSASALAVLADRSRSETVGQDLIFMPMAISLVGAAVIWRFVYDHPAREDSRRGLLNDVIGSARRRAHRLLRQRGIIPWNNFFIMVIMIWIQTGFAMVVLSAASRRCRSSCWRRPGSTAPTRCRSFWRITLPQIVADGRRRGHHPHRSP